MKYKELTEDEVFDVTRGLLTIEPGLYHYSNREDENLSWNQSNHFIYWDQKSWIWSIDYAGTFVYYGIKPGYHETMTVSKERFLEFVREKTPNAMVWILFHLDNLPPSVI
jgi:hypothetical protein